MREYNTQYMSAGSIVSECTQVSDQAHGIIRAPGMYRTDQMAGWRRKRFRRGAAMNPPDHATFYGQGPRGYADYSPLAPSRQTQELST